MLVVDIMDHGIDWKWELDMAKRFVTEWTLPDNSGGMFANQCVASTRAKADKAAYNAVARCRRLHGIEQVRVVGEPETCKYAVYDRYELDSSQL